jgi:hypothetical protein
MLLFIVCKYTDFVLTTCTLQHEMFPYKVASAPQDFENAVLGLTIEVLF